MLAAENEISARAWKLSALFYVAEHPNIYDSRMHLLPEYVRGLLLNRFQHMRKKEKTMIGVNLLSFIMPRTVQNRHKVQVLVILHGSHVLGLSTVEALLNLTIGVTVTCKPLDFGPGKDYADVTSHHIYTAFLSMLKGPLMNRLGREQVVTGGSFAHAVNRSCFFALFVRLIGMVLSFATHQSAAALTLSEVCQRSVPSSREYDPQLLPTRLCPRRSGKARHRRLLRLRA
jgi:hypothetical protein